MTPLPSRSQPIPDGWSAHHRPTVEAMMPSTVRLQRPSSDKVFDEDAGASVYPDPVVLWSGGSRIQRLSRRGGDQPVGDRNVLLQLIQVSLPISVPEPQTNDQIVVIANPDDPTLVGKILRVHEVRPGSYLWERDLTCEEVTPTTR